MLSENKNDRIQSYNITAFHKTKSREEAEGRRENHS
jgi:hypothetical protein